WCPRRASPTSAAAGPGGAGWLPRGRRRPGRARWRSPSGSAPASPPRARRASLVVPVERGVVDLPHRDPVVPGVAVEGPGPADPGGQAGRVRGAAAIDTGAGAVAERG